MSHNFTNPIMKHGGGSSSSKKSKNHVGKDHFSSKKPGKNIGPKIFGLTVSTPRPGKSSSFWGYAKVFFSSLGAILIYGLLTNIALLNGGIYVPLDTNAHNLAYILSCIVSGGAMAFACFNYIDQESVYASPVDALLSWFHKRPDTTFWYTMTRLLGQFAGAFIMAGLLFLIYRDDARVKLAASVVNPLNNPSNESAFAAFCFETIGTVVIALAIFTLDAKHRRAADRALIKGIIVFAMRLAVYQYTGASFNVFLSFAMNATTNQWSTFVSGTYYIYWLAAGVSLVVCALAIVLQRYFARFFSEYDRNLYDTYARKNKKNPEMSSNTDHQGHPAFSVTVASPFETIDDVQDNP